MKNEVKNSVKLTIPSYSVNEGFARAAVSAFCARHDPAPTELADVKCAVSEAVTNCIVHAYRESVGNIYITATSLDGSRVKIEIRDRGVGIPNVSEARQPLYTTDAAGERSGMGFTVMESFMDKVNVRSTPGKGTTVVMYKKFSSRGSLT